jgi:hypothetical protein
MLFFRGLGVTCGYPERTIMNRIALLFFLSLITGCSNIHREDYGVKSEDLKSCVKTEIIEGPKKYPAPLFYNAEEISNIYLLYGVASLNTYTYTSPAGKVFASEGGFSKFTVAQYDASWVKQDRIFKANGLALDYYINDSDPEVYKVLIAFRGTEFDSFDDWYANLSWLTQLLPFKNQYDYSREAVAEIRTKVTAVKGQKKVSYIATGHSLGGGLAEHVADAFPCTSAVVFDTSFVVNRFRLAEPFEDAEVVHIFDKNDELTFVKRLFLSDSESPTYKRYGVNPVAKGTLQHSSERLVVGMAGTVAMCQVPGRDHSGCPLTDLKAKKLYCGSNYAKLEQAEPQCKF